MTLDELGLFDANANAGAHAKLASNRAELTSYDTSSLGSYGISGDDFAKMVTVYELLSGNEMDFSGGSP
jgi:hypothetical protein